jgi:hypothetical protein
VSVNRTLVEAKMCRFAHETTHFIFNKCPITLTTVQVPTLALTHMKRITVGVVRLFGSRDVAGAGDGGICSDGGGTVEAVVTAILAVWAAVTAGMATRVAVMTELAHCCVYDGNTTTRIVTIYHIFI